MSEKISSKDYKDSNDQNIQRDTFGSRLGIIAAAAGSAIGLGNIWKFPYITGIYGGAAFIIIYLVCISIIGLPVMLSEFIIGRKAQKNAIGAFKKLSPGTPWFLTGWMGVVGAFLIFAYYGVVAGWTLEYIYRSIIGGFSGMSPAQIGTEFEGFISAVGRPIFWQVMFIAITSYIVIAGVKDGIEKYSKILMPMLLIIILVLCVRAITLPGSQKGLEFLFKPQISAVTANSVLIALGQAFFSLSIGMGTMITYGSYMKKKENLAKTAIQVTASDTLIALLAGIAIFPAVFAFGIEPDSGPGLVFVTLPNVFNKMPGGMVFAILFFILLAVAALTSAISILEVIVAYLVEELKITRGKATIFSSVVITLLGIPCSLSMGIMSDVLIFGKNFFGLLEWISSNLLLPLGGLLITLFVGWYLGREQTREELSNEGTIQEMPYLRLFMFICRFVAPIAILIVFLYGLGVIKF